MHAGITISAIARRKQRPGGRSDRQAYFPDRGL